MKKKIKKEETDLPGYPVYPQSEDIYSKFKEEAEIDPEDNSRKKEIADQDAVEEESDDLTGEDLDVPGSELDDEQENIGSEDEENNLYSLGGDNHDD